MNSSYMLFIGILISNALSSDFKETDAKIVDGARKGNDVWRNDIPSVKSNNVYDSVNKPNSICVNNVNNFFDIIGINNDGLLNNNDPHVNNLYHKHADIVSSSNFFLDIILNRFLLSKNNRIRLKRHLTRKPKTKRPSKTTPQVTKTKETKTTKIFDLGKTFDMGEFEKYLNDDLRNRKSSGVIKSGDYTEEDITRKKNITYETKSNVKKIERHSYESNRTIFEAIDSNPMNMTSVEVRELKHFVQHKHEYDDEDMTGEYNEAETSVRTSKAIRNDGNLKNVDKKPYKDGSKTNKDKAIGKKRRVKRAAKKGGKNKKGTRRDRSGFDFGFGKKKNTQNKYKQGKKGKTGGGGFGGGFGGGKGKKGGGTGGGAKKKNKKGSDSSSGEYLNIGDFFQMGGDDDDDDDEDDEYYEDESEYYDVDSEEELSHRGGGRGGRNQNKGKNNNNQNKYQNKHQNKNQNAQEGDGIVREKLKIMEIKDEDDSIFRKRNVHIVSNKKGGKTQQQQQQQQQQKQQQQQQKQQQQQQKNQDIYVHKGPMKKLEYLNDTKTNTNFEPYYGIKLRQKNNRIEYFRRVKRFAGPKKAMPKKAKKSKPKNTKRAHKGGPKRKSKKDGGKKKKLGSDGGFDSEDISREKLTITEVKSGEDRTQDKKEIAQPPATDTTSSKDADKNEASVKSPKTSKKVNPDLSESLESQSDEDDSDEKNTQKKSDEGSSKSHLSVPDHLIPEEYNSKDGKTNKKYKDIQKVLGVDVEKMKEKYEVNSEELGYEMERAKKYWAEQEKKSMDKKKMKTKKGTTKKKSKRRGPPTRHTTKKRREKKKVFDYSAEYNDKDKNVKDGIKAMIQELNVSTRCDYCGSGKASIQHVLAGCKMALYFGFYSRRHDRVLKMIRNAFELALDQANRTSGITLPRQFGRDAISSENLTIINIQFLSRLRYILSHKPEVDNTTKRRGRKLRTTPNPLNSFNASLAVNVSFNAHLNQSLDEAFNANVNKNRVEMLAGETSLVDGKVDPIGEAVSMEDVDLHREETSKELRKEDSPVRELTSYEFKMNLERHSNVFVEPDFSRENPLHPFISNNKVRSILDLADDWQLFSDNRDSRYSFPITELQNSSLLKPDLLLLSRRLKYMLILELTIPWDFNMMRQSSSKSKKYRSLVQALNEAKYNVHFHAVQVGLTGYVGPELEILFKSLGLDKLTRRRYLADISNSTLQSSLAIWNRKQERKWKFWIFWKKRNQEKYRFKHGRGRKRGGTGGKKS